MVEEFKVVTSKSTYFETEANVTCGKKWEGNVKVLNMVVKEIARIHNVIKVNNTASAFMC
jgi:hypothetical protein